MVNNFNKIWGQIGAAVMQKELKFHSVEKIVASEIWDKVTDRTDIRTRIRAQLPKDAFWESYGEYL